MKQKKVNIITTDLNAEFERHVNLNNLIAQDRACQTLQVVTDEHHWNSIEQSKHPIKPILIYGKHSCSTVARAFSNTIGNTEFADVVGPVVGFGFSLADQLTQMGEHITYHISDFDKMVYYYKQPLHTLVKDSVIKLDEVPFRHKAVEKRFTGLLILSLQDETAISSEMEKHCEAVIRLGDYEDGDISQILEQRIALYGLIIEEQKKIVDAIVNVVNCDVKLSIELLHWGYKCCRAMGEFAITTKHLNKALHLKK